MNLNDSLSSNDRLTSVRRGMRRTSRYLIDNMPIISPIISGIQRIVKEQSERSENEGKGWKFNNN